jgi:hypothetical protein
LLNEVSPLTDKASAESYEFLKNRRKADIGHSAVRLPGRTLFLWNPYGQKIETAQRRQRSNIFGLGPVLHNKLAVDA